MEFFGIIDEIYGNGFETARVLYAALHELTADPTVRLPRRELTEYLKRYKNYDEGIIFSQARQYPIHRRWCLIPPDNRIHSLSDVIVTEG